MERLWFDADPHMNTKDAWTIRPGGRVTWHLQAETAEGVRIRQLSVAERCSYRIWSVCRFLLSSSSCHPLDLCQEPLFSYRSSKCACFRLHPLLRTADIRPPIFQSLEILLVANASQWKYFMCIYNPSSNAQYAGDRVWVYDKLNLDKAMYTV